MKRPVMLAASTALAVGLTLAGAGGATASDYKSGTRSCSGTFTWSGATSSASTYHIHTSGTRQSTSTGSAGTSAHRGLYDSGSAFLSTDTSGTFSSWSFGCQ